MKAVIWTRYGGPDGIELRDVPTPEPQAGEVRIRIEASTVTAGDCELRALRFPWFLRLPIRAYVGWTRPKRLTILGQEYAGTIDKLGEGVANFKLGDKVYAAAAMPRLGGHAEYAVVPAAPGDGMLALRPEALSAEEAAAIPFAAFEARYFLRKARVARGERVLIVGAGGSIGSYAVQIAKAAGAEVTAVDRPAKHQMLREIGADHVVDAAARSYDPNATRRDRWAPGAGATAMAANDDASAPGFDVVLDVVGRGTFGRGFRALRRGGRFVSANPRFSLLFRGLVARIFSGKRVIVGTANHSPDAIADIGELIEARQLKPVIGKRFALDDIVDAYRYAESGEKIGNVVVRCG